MISCAKIVHRTKEKYVMGPYAFLQDETPVFLAPMSGVTDAPFRKQVMKYGAEVTITEMVAGEELLNGSKSASTRLVNESLSGAHVVQLVGREERALKYGAERARDAGAHVIDINMGCPSRRVTGGLSGSALMRDLDKAERLIHAVLKGAEGIPVTLKMRLGWDWDSINASELALRAENSGIRLVTVHGRTRQDFYEGKANWAAIADVVDAVSIPVIANGDIEDLRSAELALDQSKAAGVMVGRAATGKAWLVPWLQARLNGREYALPSMKRQIESLIEQAEDSVSLYGERTGMRVVRKHLSEAVSHWAGSCNSQLISQDLRQALLRSESVSALSNALFRIEDSLMEVAA